MPIDPHFYHHAIRFEETFRATDCASQATAVHRVEMDFAEETAQTYRRHAFDYKDMDVIVLEGIYLLKRGFLH